MTGERSAKSFGSSHGAPRNQNGWNSEKLYIDCFVDEEGDPWFTYDVNLSPGGTRDALDDAFAVWLSFVPDMQSMIGR